MDITAVFADQIEDRSLLQRLLPDKKGVLFFENNALDAITFNCQAIILCHRVASRSSIPRFPIDYNTSRLVVLSDSSHETTIVETLSAGAHHFIDFRQSEKVLAARINAALRFHSQHEYHTLDVEPYIFNQTNRTAYYNNNLLNLSPREFELAYYLFANRNRIVSDSELMTSVWTLPPSVDTRRIDTSICRIKRKMNLNAASSKWKILRLRQTGYQVKC